MKDARRIKANEPHNRRRHRLKGPLQARHKQTEFILLLPQTAALPGSDCWSDVLASLSSTVRPRAPCGARDGAHC